MPFSGTTYSEIEAARAEVAAIIKRQQDRLSVWKTQAGLISTELTTAGTEYGPIVAASAVLLATDPTNEAFIVLDKAINKHLADFNALSADASANDLLINPAP